ncbi:hypothetical protein ABG554_001263 [Escherichia coli]|nr:hypothetical protein [Escherichia coli]EJB5997376.1 hypothetical protein [Escherichia coli]
MSFSVQETLFSLLQHNAISGHENAVADVMLCEFRRQLDKIITIHRVKQVVTASLKLRDYDGQVAEAMPMIPK